MAKHANTPEGEVRVLDGQHRTTALKAALEEAQTERILDRYDATQLIGLRVVVCNAAVERVGSDGERTIELPKQRELFATAAVARCLIPIRLRGSEVKAM